MAFVARRKKLMAFNHLLVSLSLGVALLLCGNHVSFTYAASGGIMGGSHFSSDSNSNSDEDSSWSDSPYRSHHSWHSAPPTYYGSPASDCRNGAECDRSSEGVGWVGLCTVIAFIGGGFLLVRSSKKTTVLMVQVGLSGEALLPIQTDLNKIAEHSDTSTVKGLKHMLTETVLVLLRHADHFTHGYSCVYNRGNLEDTEKCFNHLSLQERLKFDVVSLSNVNNIKIERTSATQKQDIQKQDKPTKEYIVVTLLLAAKGGHILAQVEDRAEEVKEALGYLQSISSKTTLAAEVLWSPQDDNDSISEQELHGKYPLLRPF